MVVIFHIWVFGWNDWKNTVNGSLDHLIDREAQQIVEEINPLAHPPSSEGDDTSSRDIIAIEHEKGIFIGMSEELLIERLGEPTRKDPSAYGYEWWVYNQDWKKYIQIGIYQNKVNMLYTNAPTWSWGKIVPGMEYSEWKENWVEQSELSFQYDLGFFTFSLSEQDIRERPLTIDQKTAIQLYVDIHDHQKISGIRVMDLSTLLLHRPYALKYVGKLPEPLELSANEWKRIELAYEKQIFDIVNVTRSLHQLTPFEWHDDVAIVAKGHSQDMLDNQFFDHRSPEEGELSDRLAKGKVAYRSAGENIAWNYIDAADAHEGWLNSLGHRKNVVKPEFTYLGVGVVEKYYTQNFLSY